MTGLEFIMAARAFPGERFALPSATLEIGRRIINRELAAVARAGETFAPGEEVYAHSDVSGHGAGFIEHVWTHDGVEVPMSLFSRCRLADCRVGERTIEVILRRFKD